MERSCYLSVRRRSHVDIPVTNKVPNMSSVDLNDRIPNNVDLASDRRLRRALEQ